MRYAALSLPRSLLMLKKIPLFLGFGLALVAGAQTADQAWLKYEMQGRKLIVPVDVRALGTSAPEKSAVEELNRDLGSLADKRDPSPVVHTKTWEARQSSALCRKCAERIRV